MVNGAFRKHSDCFALVNCCPQNTTRHSRVRDTAASYDCSVCSDDARHIHRDIHVDDPVPPLSLSNNNNLGMERKGGRGVGWTVVVEGESSNN